jgi:hypothetical protein
MADQLDPRIIEQFNEAVENLTKTLGGETASASSRSAKMDKASQDFAKSFDKMQKAVGAVSGVLGKLKDGAQGASEMNGAVDKTTEGISALASVLGLLFPPLRLLAMVVGGAAKAGGEYIKAVNKQSDALFDSYKKLSSSGLSDAGGMRNIFDNMQKFGYGIEQLGEMTELLKANSTELAAFGGTAASGTKAFADAAAEIQRNPIGKSLQMLGKTPDDINKGIAGFIKQQQQAGATSTSIQTNLAQRSAEYIKQLDLMSKLTGESAEALQENRKQAMAENAFNQTIYELRKRQAAGDTAAGEKADELLKASDLLKATPELQKIFWQSAGGDIGAGSKLLTMGMSDVYSYIQSDGFKAAKMMDMTAKGMENFSNSGMASLYKFNGTLDDVAISAQERNTIESRGADKSMKVSEDLAKAEQELQQKGLDPATKAQVGLRIEQMKTRDSLESLVNKGIEPVTNSMKALAGATESVVDKIPGSSTSTGKQMGGGESSGGWLRNALGLGGGKSITGQSGALLDIIGRGESGGNYNALVGGKKGGPAVEKNADLTNMTIAEVQQMQKSMIGKGHASTAVGKYQFISATLAEQVKKSGLDPNKTKFDQKTQDLLAQQLIDQAGVGRTDTATAMKKLAGTWASLPKDMSGRGAYDGFNGNKAGIDPNELAMAINKGQAMAIAGPSNKYDSKTAGVNPAEKLPTAPATSAGQAQADPNEPPAWLNSLTGALEQQNRLFSDVADNTKRTAQNTGV